MNKIAVKIIPDCVKSDLKCSTKEEALKILCETLLKQKFVKDDFYNQIIKREKNFPTGLQTRTLGVAIPHTDPQYVLSDSIAVGILKNPVVFHEMTNVDKDVNVTVIFLLALTDATKHLKILSKIMEIIKDENSLKRLLNENENEICHDLNNKILVGNN